MLVRKGDLLVANVGALPNGATASVQPCSLCTKGACASSANACRRALNGAIPYLDPCPPKDVTCSTPQRAYLEVRHVAVRD